MNKKKSKYIMLLLLISSMALIGLIIFQIFFSTKIELYQAIVYNSNPGFGYSIMRHGKLLIKQDFIPTVENNQPFCSYDDAEKIANLVLEKLNKKENPKIINSELKQYHIKLNCIN